MTTTAVVTMIVVCGVIWGGFASLLVRAVRSEGRKPGDAVDGRAEHGEE